MSTYLERIAVSYDSGRTEEKFVYPGDVAPVGLAINGAGNLLSAKSAVSRARTAAATRGSSRLRRLLPVAIAILASIVFAMLTDGGRQAREAVPVAVYLDHVLGKLGLGISEVTVKGQHMTQDSEIYARLQLEERHSIWLLDTEAARARVETLPWVSRASLKRVFPDRLHVDIRERVPIAIWNNGSRAVLLDDTGRVLGPATSGRFAKLPAVFGAGAAPHVRSILEIVGRIPELHREVRLYERVANRRWTLHLKSGQQVLLPARSENSALEHFTHGKKGQRLIDSNFKKLDLRLKDEMAVEFRK